MHLDCRDYMWMIMSGLQGEKIFEIPVNGTVNKLKKKPAYYTIS